MQQLDISAPAFRADPYPIYARLRRDSPVVTVERPLIGKLYLLTRYDDCADAFTDPRLANDPRKARSGPDPFDRWWTPPLLRALQRNMLACDEPDHRRLRDLVHRAFTPRRVDQLKGSVEQIVTRLLDAAARARQPVDLMSAFALPLPLTVISEMMGVPEADRLTFHDRMAKFLDTNFESRLQLVRQIPNSILTLRFFRRLIRLRRREPGDDLLTALVQAEEKGDRLSEDELIAMIFLLLLAGHETTVNLIGNGTLALLQHPEQLRRLRDDPELIGSAVEELLRFTNPVAEPAARFAREDIELHGTVIPRGSIVLPLLASANRDEAAFERADQLDLGRNPNRHVAFGLGVHYCLGAPLARLEAKIALLALVQRFPNMRLAVPAERLRWRGSINLRGLTALPLHLS